MGYTGGLINHFMWNLQPQWIYAVLRTALSQVSEELPFRGPLSYEYYGFEYSNHPLGHLAEFLGEETIKYRGALVLLDLQSPASRTVLADDLPAEPQSAAAQQYSEVRLAHSL